MVQNFTKRYLHIYFSFVSKKTSFLLFALFIIVSASAQQVSFSDLIHFSSAGKKLDVLIKKFGFRPEGMINYHDSVAYAYNYIQEEKLSEDTSRPKENIFKEVLRFNTVDKNNIVAYKTSMVTEDVAIKQELKNAGFNYTFYKNDYLFQKGNVTVKCFTEIVDTNLIYNYSIQIRQLPNAKEIVYAEDLFQLSSHEYLVAVFGAENVKKDLFYMQGNKTTQCSVLFPNTKMEAVFVWGDGPNYKNILALRIGGDAKTVSSLKYQRSIEQNIWQFREGLYIGMSMRELKKVTDRNLVSSNAFKNNSSGDNYSGKMGLLLGCMNCGDAHYLQADYANFSEPVDEGRKIYISTVIMAGNASKN